MAAEMKSSYSYIYFRRMRDPLININRFGFANGLSVNQPQSYQSGQNYYLYDYQCQHALTIQHSQIFVCRASMTFSLASWVIRSPIGCRESSRNFCPHLLEILLAIPSLPHIKFSLSGVLMIVGLLCWVTWWVTVCRQ
jgi:hypothetical protein